MAEVVLASVVSAVLKALKESLQLQGAQGIDLERATSGDRPLYQVPELQLNICMVSELFVQILATGLGALALVWATVVLLGGFSASLEGADFWVITAIVFIQTARVVGINVSPEAEFFNRVPPAFLELGAEHYTTWGQRRPLTGRATGKNFVNYLMLALRGAGRDLIIVAVFAILVLAVPKFAGAGCISLSIYRLVSLLSRHHENSNVFRALILFYALVLLQGGLFIMWLILRLYRSYLTNGVSLKYGLQDKRELFDKYTDKTLSMAIKNGVSSTINRNMASFAADLIKSDYSQDHIDAVWVIHTLTSQEDHRTRTLSQIQSSPLCVSRLLDMVTSKSRTDQRIKICIAEIVAHLASNLCLADISGATESISSMIDPYFAKISRLAASVNSDHQAAIDIINDQPGGKPLIFHGLLILAKLSVNPDNCRQIYDSKGLFSKIISPVKNKVYEILDDDGIAMEITDKALEVVSMLVSGTDEINGKIREDICSNGIAVNDICPIFQRDHLYNKLKVPAIKILTEIYLDISTRATIGLDNIAVFIKVLMNMLVDANNESGLRKTAGAALARLAMDNTNCTTIINFPTVPGISVQLLTAMIPKADGRLYRTSIAELLMQFCANSNSNEERERLKSVKTILHEVLKVICNVEQGANTNQAGPPQQNLGQQQAANANQEGLSQHNLGQQQAANANQAGPSQHNPGQQQTASTDHTGPPQHNSGQQQAANANQAGFPHHKSGQPPVLPRALHHLNSFLGARHSHRNIKAPNLPAVAKLVGDRIKSLAAFLGLALQICEKLDISSDEFDTTLANIPLSMGEFVDKLNDIIDQCNGHSIDSLEGKRPSFEYLIIIKTVTKLCTWMMESKPDCIPEFQSKNTSTKLQGALEDMRELELGMLLAGSAGDTANYETLSAIVATARQKMDANVQGRTR